jgi:hypothetical protein
VKKGLQNEVGQIEFSFHPLDHKQSVSINLNVRNALDIDILKYVFVFMMYY